MKKFDSSARVTDLEGAPREPQRVGEEKVRQDPSRVSSLTSTDNINKGMR